MVQSLLSNLEQFLGPHKENVPKGVKVQQEAVSPDELIITLNATADQEGISTGAIDIPAVYIKWVPAKSECANDLHFLGFQCAEFALPIRAPSCDLSFNFFSRPGYQRPQSVFPLFTLNRKTGRCLLLAPLDSFHDQVLAVGTQGERELRWGWSGDLKGVPAGFSTSLGVFASDSPRAALLRWGECVRSRANTHVQSGRYADVSTANLSMWTDNGASYWYRTEPGMDMPTTLERTVSALDEAKVPVASIEIDSWWYDHEIPRRISPIGYPDVVPPTGMLRWEPRADALGAGGMHALRSRLTDRPLVLHARHISALSTYVNDPSLAGTRWWTDGGRTHPRDAALWRTWMQQAADWGATCVEQDWLVEIWMGVRQLRERPGRIAEWQKMFDAAATERAISLIWCMATPADFAEAVSLDRVVAIRTCDDYRYAADASDLWRWHLTVSCMARALGLWPFKDVFMSHTNGGTVADIMGDPNYELEALLSALSAGPVGIGDRLGRTYKDVVMRTCRADGVLIKPELPLCAMDRSLTDANSLLWADTWSGEWRYVVAINATRKKDAEKSGDIPLKETLELPENRLAYNWRTKNAENATTLTAELRSHEWCFWVLCPIRPGSSNASSFAVIGDTSVYATMGDRRIRVNTKFSESSYKPSLDVVGVPGEKVSVAYWLSDKGMRSVDVTIGKAAWSHIDFPAAAQ